MDIKGGFKESALRLNRYVIKQDTWNKDRIKERLGELYEKLNQEILDSSPDTKVEYTKNYIAYKYETSYCDIIPQLQGLKIYINMNFDEIDDLDKIGIDISNKGT